MDSHVGKHIFDKVLSSDNGILRNRTRILITNALFMLADVDQIILLKNGTIEAIGSYDELQQNNETFHDLIVSYNRTLEDEGENGIELIEGLKIESKNIVGSGGEVLITTLEKAEDEEMLNDMNHLKMEDLIDSGGLSKPNSIVFKERHSSVLSTVSSKRSSIHTLTTYKSKRQHEEQEAALKDKSKLVHAEHMETGQVTFEVYLKFFEAISLFWTGMIVINYLLIAVANTGSSFWLNTWTADDQGDKTPGYYLLIYFLIGCGQATCVVTGWFSIMTGTMRASGTLHWRLLNSIVHAPMWFFDTTPLGRIVNRFSKDFDVLDTFIQLILRYVYVGRNKLSF